MCFPCPLWSWLWEKLTPETSKGCIQSDITTITIDNPSILWDTNVGVHWTTQCRAVDNADSSLIVMYNTHWAYSAGTAGIWDAIGADTSEPLLEWSCERNSRTSHDSASLQLDYTVSCLQRGASRWNAAYRRNVPTRDWSKYWSCREVTWPLCHTTSPRGNSQRTDKLTALLDCDWQLVACLSLIGGLVSRSGCWLAGGCHVSWRQTRMLSVETVPIRGRHELVFTQLYPACCVEVGSVNINLHITPQFAYCIFICILLISICIWWFRAASYSESMNLGRHPHKNGGRPEEDDELKEIIELMLNPSMDDTQLHILLQNFEIVREFLYYCYFNEIYQRIFARWFQITPHD